MKQFVRELFIALSCVIAAAWLAPMSRGQAVGSAIAGAIPFQFWDNSGVILAGGKICTYQGGTTTPLAAFTDATLATPQTNPIILDSSGRPTGGQGIFIGQAIQYKFVALLGGDGTCSTGAVIWTRDRITNAGAVSAVNGTANQITVTTLGSVATIAVVPNLTTQTFTANNTGSGLVFNSANLVIDGNGNLSATGVLLSHGGFLSEANIWNAFNSPTDGAFLRAFDVAQNMAGTAGGYFELEPVTYNPYNSPTACHDQFGNIVTQPLPLTGVTFGPNALLLWNSTSPFMPADNSCGIPLPVNTDYGINTNGYLYARAGLATDIVAYNSFDSLRGGIHVALGATVDQAVYPKGQTSCPVLNPPAAGYGGFGYISGSIYCYYNDSTTSWNTVDLSMSGGGGGGTCGSDTQVQYNNMNSCGASSALTFNYTNGTLTVTGVGIVAGGAISASGIIASTGASGGVNVSTATAGNGIQIPNGGMFAKTYTWAEEAVPANSNASQALLYGDSTSHMLNWSENGSSFQKIASFKGSFTTGDCAQIDITLTVISVLDAGGPCTTGGGGGTVTGSAQFNCGFYSAAGTATTIGGNAAFVCNPGSGTLTVTGTGLITNGAFNSTATGSSTAFQANGGAFSVTGAGAVSAAGVFASTGASGGFNVTTNTAAASIQSIGGINACNAGTCASGAAFLVGGATVINSGRGAAFTSIQHLGVTGLTQCAQFNSSGVMSGTGSACGSGGGGGVTGIVGSANQVLANGTSGSTQTGTVNLTLPQSIATSSNVSFATVTTSGAIQSTVTGGSVGLQVNGGTFQAFGNGNVNAATINGLTFQLNGTTIVDGSRNAIFNQGSFGSAVTMNGGFSTGSFTNSVLFIGTSGNLYNRTTGASTGISCSGIQDGWQAITSDGFIVECLSGGRFRAALASY